MKMTLTELELVGAALRKNRMAVHCVQTKEEVAPLVEKLLKKGDTVAVGGSVTLSETGVLDLLQNGEYRFLDRYAPGLTVEQENEVLRQSLLADTYLCSSNAVTRNGELYNVDGRANRVAAFAFGPKSVIVVVGCNKIVDDLKEAVHRVKTIAAPLNAKRLKCETYCAVNGVCKAADSENMTDGCASPARICADFLISGMQRVPDRIQVILVGESLGF